MAFSAALVTDKAVTIGETNQSIGIEVKSTAEAAVRVTVTGAADFGSIAAGVMVVYVYYLATV